MRSPSHKVHPLGSINVLIKCDGNVPKKGDISKLIFFPDGGASKKRYSDTITDNTDSMRS